MLCHVKEKMTVNYQERQDIVKNHHFLANVVDETKLTVNISQISVTTFRNRIQKETFVELYHVYLCHTNSIFCTGERAGPWNDFDYDIMTKTYANNPQLVVITKNGRHSIRKELPAGLPPERAIDYRNELEAGTKKPFRRLHELFQLSFLLLSNIQRTI